MSTNDTQQEHIYNERIQEFFPLFDKKDDPIYNARVDFNTVKFLIERADWDWNEDKDKNKACGVILQECDKTKKARQELEDKAKEELNKYITIANNINDDVKDKKVSIYGNHASITLEDNKKEFKISEFLNSDFCEKNEISGFSTLHSDGKSGMHGFVAEEGGKKIRHYVVTDGSYEMTLKWYAKGEECKIKIKIDANGVDLVKGDDFSLERLEANQDIKIGGLFLHEIQFREKGKVNEVQHDGKESSEIAIKSNSRDIEQGVEKPPIGGLFSHSLQQEVESQTTRLQSNDENDSGYGSQGKNPQNKKTPPQVPTRTSSLKKDVLNEQGSGSQKPDGLRGNEQTPNNQQKGATTVSRSDSRDNYDFPSSDPSDSSTFTKSVSHNQDNRQEDERYDNPTFATFGHAVPGSQKPDRSEQTPNDQQQPEIPQQEGNSKSDLLQEIRNFKKNNLRHTDVDDREASIAGSRKNNPSPLETLKDRIPYSPSPDPDIYNSDNQSASGAEWKESEQSFSVPKPNSKSDSGSSSQIHAQPQVDPEQPKRSLENIEQSDQTPPENLLKEIRDRSQQDNRGLRQVDPTDKLSQDKEDGLQKDNLADVKTVEGPTVNVSASTPNSISDSGYISPTSSDSKPQTDLKQVGRKLEEHINLTLFEELKNTLGQENLGLKPADQSQISEETKKRLREDGLLKDSSTDVKTNDSGYSSPTHDNNEQSQVNPGQLKASLMNVEQRDDTLLTEFTSKLDKETQKFPLKPVDQRGISEQTKEHLLAAGLLKDSSTDIKANDSGYSSPTHDNNEQSQVNPEQLKASLMNVEQKDDTLLTEFTSKLDKETQKFPLKPVDQRGMSEQTKEHLLAAGLLKDSSTDVKTVAERENADTSPTVDKNSELYKLLEKDKIQLEVGVIKEEREDTLTEHTDSCDRDRIALGNRNKRPLDWTKRIAESQQEKDTNKGISI
ncbi:hypothetical protein [Wolbachia endosymbiont (group A) of Barypeithes pellucidus]|uniref:hypothetical protein n=1 Tax=Wolbachia endosymbiont (group A) of Barypeithes pellucidus TaxID=3139322 RepID=UPI003CCB3888